MNNGGLFYLSAASVSLSSSDSEFTAIHQASFGGIFYIQASGTVTADLTANSLSGLDGSNQGPQNLAKGGIFYIMGAKSAILNLKGNTVEDVSFTTGSIAYFVMSPTNQINTITMTLENELYSSILQSYGSIAFIDSHATSFSLDSTNLQISGIKPASSSAYGGAFGQLVHSTVPNLALNILMASTIVKCNDQDLSSVSSIDIQNVGPMFQFDDTSTGFVTTSLSAFSNCYQSQVHMVIKVTSGLTYSDQSSSYTQMGGYYGLFQLDGGSVTIQDVKLNNTYATYGSFIYMSKNTPLTIESSNFNFTNATAAGGAFYIKVTNDISVTTYTDIIIRSCTFSSGGLATDIGGGLIYLDHSMANLILDKNTISGFQNSLYGGVLYNAQSNSITLTSNIITDCGTSSTSGGGIIYSPVATPITMIGNTFTYANLGTVSSSSQPNQSLLNYLSKLLQNPNYSKAPMFIASSSLITSTNNVFSNAYLSNLGSVFKFSGSTLIDTGSTFQNLGSNYGAALFCSSTCKTILFNATIFKTIYAGYSAVVQADQQSVDATFTFTNITVSDTYSVNGGGFLNVSTSFNYDAGSDSYIQPIVNIVFNGQETSISDVQSTNFAGLIYSNGGNTSIVIDFGDSTASRHISNVTFSKGGLVYADKVKSVTIQNVNLYSLTFKSSTLGNGGQVIYAKSEQTQIKIANNFLQCSTTDFTSQTNMPSSISGSNSLSVKSAIYIEGIYDYTDTTLTLSNNTIQNCYSSKQAGAVYGYNLQLNDFNNTYSYNAAYNGGTIQLINAEATFLNSTFKNSFGVYGGIFNIDGFISMTFDGVTVQSSSSEYGTFLYVNLTTVASSSAQSITFLNPTVFNGLTASSSGGAFFLNSSTLSIIMENQVTLTNVQATKSNGGVFFIQNAASLKISNSLSSFKSISAGSSGAFIYSSISSTSYAFTAQISNINVQCSTDAYSRVSNSILATAQDFSASCSTYGAMLFSGARTTATLSNNKIQQCNFAKYCGGGLTGISSTISDSNSVYSYNSALLGGAIYCKSCNLAIDSLTFESNSATFGAAVYCYSNGFLKNLTLNSMKLSNQYAYQEASGFFIYNSDYSTAYSTADNYWQLPVNNLIASNIATKIGSGIFYLTDPLLSLQIKNAAVSGVTCGNGCFINAFDFRSATITDSTFENIEASSQGSLLYLQTAKVFPEGGLTMSGNSFTCSQDLTNAYQIVTTTLVASAIYVSNIAAITSTNNNFKNCYSNSKGGVYYVDQGKLTDMIFTESDSSYAFVGASQGAIVYSQSDSKGNFTPIFAFTGVTIQKSFAQEGLLFYSQDQVQLSFTDIIVTENIVGLRCILGCVVASSAPSPMFIKSFLQMENIEVTSNQIGGVNQMYKGGLISIDNPFFIKLDFLDFTVQSNTFSGISYGGFLSVTNFADSGTLTMDVKSTTLNTFEDIYANTEGQLIYVNTNPLAVKISALLVSCSEFAQSVGGGAIYLSSSSDSLGTLTADQLTIQYCFGNQSGGAMHLEQYKAVILLSNFSNNYATGGGGGAIYCSNCQLQVNSSAFTYHQATYGGAILIDDYHNVNINSCDFLENTATNSGGVISVKNTDTTLNLDDFASYLTLDSCTIYYNLAYIAGGVISINSVLSSTTFTSCDISENMAKAQVSTSTSTGGFAFSTEFLSFSIQSSTIADTYASIGAFMDMSSATKQGELDLVNIQLNCNTTLDLLDLIAMLNTTSTTYAYQSTTYLYNLKQVTSISNSFQYCGAANQGGVFSLDTVTNFTDSNSLFQYNGAIQGGVMSLTDEVTKVYFSNSEFKYNYASRGGVFYIEQKSYARFSAVAISYNYGFNSAGVMYVATEAYFDMLSSDILYNYANTTSFLEVLQSSTSKNITIYNTLIQGHQSTMNTISLMYSLAIFTSCTFSENLATSRTKNIFTGFSTLFIYSSSFKDVVYSNQTARVLKENTLGAFLFITFDSEVYIQKTTFYFGCAYQGGAIYLSGKGDVKILNSVFKSNYAATQGGAIYAEDFSSFKIALNSTLANNKALSTGDDFYMSNSDNSFELDQVSISNPGAKTSLFASSLTLNVSRSSFTNVGNGKSTESVQGAAIQCISCNQINITKSTFSSCKSKAGGCIYLSSSNSDKDTSKATKFTISSSTFYNSTANEGGAIYLDNIQSLNVLETVFSNNSAKNSSDGSTYGIGGAIYFTCDEYDQNCALYLSGKTNFSYCYADVKGGAIYWDLLEPVYSSSLGFTGNSAFLYGDDKACFAQKLAQITAAQYESHLVSKGLVAVDDLAMLLQRRMLDSSLKTNETISNAQSGGNIPTTYLAHVDQYDQIVGDDFSSKVRVQVDATYSVNKSAKYSAIIQGTSSFTSEAGVVMISGVQFAASPGFTYRISYTTDGIDTSKPSNEAYMKQNSIADTIDYKQTISLRNCTVGEYFTSAGECLTCASDTSYSLVVMTEPGDCTVCPTTEAVCNGGSNIGPLPGYWRKSNRTSTFIKCLYTPACLGMVSPDYNAMGACLTGYQGILCADCQPGYSRTGSYECSQCPDTYLNVLRLSAIMIFAVCLVVFMIRSTLAGAKNKTNVTNIYVKILMNHIQLIVLTASFKFDWPDQVQSFFSTATPVASATTQIVSVDCFLKGSVAVSDPTSTVASSDGSYSRTFYYKLVMLALFPFVTAAVSILFWTIYQRCVGVARAGNVSGKAMSTLIIILFLIHPSIVSYMFFNFKCYTVDGDSRVQDDLQIVCGSTAYKVYAYFVAVPSLVVWGFGIPFFGYLMLSRVKNSLDKLETRERLGFLYRGYRKAFYFWEVIIMYRKIAVIFISVFLSTYGVITQALVVFILLISFLFFNMKREPFQTTALNDLETLSLFTSMLTMYCGLFYASSIDSSYINADPDLTGSMSLDNNSKLFFFAVIMASNGWFFFTFAYQMYFEIKQKLIGQAPRIYMFVCLCGDESRLKIEILQRKLAEENDFLREEYFKMIDKIKETYHSGELILNPHSLEKLLIFLEPKKIAAIASYERKDGEEVLKAQDKRKNRIVNQIQNKNLLKVDQIKFNQQQKKRGRTVKVKPDGNQKTDKGKTPGSMSRRSDDGLNHDDGDIGFSDTEQSGVHKYTNSEDQSEDPRVLNTKSQSGRGLAHKSKKKNGKGGKRERMLDVNISQLENEFSADYDPNPQSRDYNYAHNPQSARGKSKNKMMKIFPEEELARLSQMNPNMKLTNSSSGGEKNLLEVRNTESSNDGHANDISHDFARTEARRNSTLSVNHNSKNYNSKIEGSAKPENYFTINDASVVNYLGTEEREQPRQTKNKMVVDQDSFGSNSEDDIGNRDLDQELAQQFKQKIEEITKMKHPIGESVAGTIESASRTIDQIVILPKDNANDIKKKRKKRFETNLEQMMHEQYEQAVENANTNGQTLLGGRGDSVVFSIRDKNRRQQVKSMLNQQKSHLLELEIEEEQESEEHDQDMLDISDLGEDDHQQEKVKAEEGLPQQELQFL